MKVLILLAITMFATLVRAEIEAETSVETCVAIIMAASAMSDEEQFTEFETFWRNELLEWKYLDPNTAATIATFDTIIFAYKEGSVSRVETYHAAYNCRDARTGAEVK